MTDKATKVRYDTSEAIKNLNKLDRTVRKSGKTAKTSFNKAGGSVKNFEKWLIGLNPQVAAFSGQINGAAAAIAGMNPAFVGVAAAAVAATAAFIDWGEAGRTAIQNIEAAANTAKQNIESIDVLSASETEEATRGLRQELRDLKQTQADRKIADSQIKTEQAALQSRILQRKAALDQMLEAEKQNAKNIAEARDRAMAGSGATGAQLNRQIQDILDRASKVGRTGDVQRQQKLLDDARKLAQDAERPDFFLQRILQQERGIATGQDKGGGQELQKRKKALQDEIKALERRNKALSIASQKILAAQKADSGRRTRVNEEIKRIEAESDIADSIARQNENLAAGNQILQTRLGVLEGIKENFKTGASILFGEGEDVQRQQRGQIDSQFAAGQRGLQAAEVGNIEGLRDSLREIDEVQKQINAAKAKNDFTNAYKEREDGVKRLREQIVAAIKEQANLDRALGNVTSSRGEAIRQGQAAPNPNRELGPAETTTNQNFSINITGGNFDEATVKKLVDRLKREFRKETADRP